VAGQDSSVALQVSHLLQLHCAASLPVLVRVLTCQLVLLLITYGSVTARARSTVTALLACCACSCLNRRQQRLRADSYRALRLLDLALTSWSSVWAEGQEFAQKAAFFLAGRQSELQVLVLRAWGPQAARLRLKREHLEM